MADVPPQAVAEHGPQTDLVAIALEGRPPDARQPPAPRDEAPESFERWPAWLGAMDMPGMDGDGPKE